jgi:predicted porin
MKKVLLSSAAVLGLVAFAPAANAQDGGLNLDVGGHFKGYGVITDQDEANNQDVSDVDMLRETEIHLSGETTLDNGLTVGAHIEAEADRELVADNNGDTATEGFAVDESYAYFAGGWGRVNLGNEDGAAYLLQVAAPSADSNIDGIRQFVQPVNYDVLTGSPAGTFTNVQWDYDNDFTTEEDKFTYLTPNVQGFQAGVSYTPDVNSGVANALQGPNEVDGAAGNAHDEAWEVAARYEGDFDKLGVNLGAGYMNADKNNNAGAGVDDQEEWNIGADFDWGPFGLGAVYTENNNGSDVDGQDENETWVVGLDYTTGPFKVGGSYYNNEQNGGTVGNPGDDLDTDRYTGGVNYSFGPGMSFRGSVSYIDHEIDGSTPFAGNDDNADATSFLLGTQVNF